MGVAAARPESYLPLIGCSISPAIPFKHETYFDFLMSIISPQKNDRFSFR
jgi:hypothetical protein